MQVVIDIDENLYTRLFDMGANTMRDMRAACSSIRNGTPLPKGHGRLIDADKLVPDCQEDSVYYDDDEHSEFTAVGIAQIECADTIIETDKEGKLDEAD